MTSLVLVEMGKFFLVQSLHMQCLVLFVVELVVCHRQFQAHLTQPILTAVVVHQDQQTVDQPQVMLLCQQTIDSQLVEKLVVIQRLVCQQVFVQSVWLILFQLKLVVIHQKNRHQLLMLLFVVVVYQHHVRLLFFVYQQQLVGMDSYVKQQLLGLLIVALLELSIDQPQRYMVCSHQPFLQHLDMQLVVAGLVKLVFVLHIFQMVLLLQLQLFQTIFLNTVENILVCYLFVE